MSKMQNIWANIFCLLLFFYESSASHFEISEAKVSEVCSYLANTCSKCVQLKACFWCPEGPEEGRCLANYNSLSRYHCLSRNVNKLGGELCLTEQQIEEENRGKAQLLVKLLALLKRLHTLKNGERSNMFHSSLTLTTAATTITNGRPANDSSMWEKRFFNKSVVPTMENLRLNKSVTSSISNTVSNNDSVQNVALNLTADKNDSSVNITFHSTTPPLSSVHKESCLSKNKNECFNSTLCFWNEDKCDLTSELVDVTKFHVKEVLCERSHTCRDCISSTQCYWCEKSKTCHSYVAAEYIPVKCENMWYHGSCSYKTTVFLVVVPVLSILLFLGIAYLCIKNCYYHQLKPVEVKLEERPILFKEKNGRTVYQITESEDEEEDGKFVTEKSNLFW